MSSDRTEEYNRVVLRDLQNEIKSLRTQLEEQKALVARLTVSAQQDAAILKAARRLVENETDVDDRLAKDRRRMTLFASLCKAVRGEKDIPTG